MERSAEQFGGEPGPIPKELKKRFVLERGHRVA